MHLSKWLREMHVSLSLCFVSVTERWHFIQVNGQGANTWKTPKGWKEWLWSNVLSSHVITPDSWSGRGENVGRCYGYWRKRGGWKEISDTVPRLDERRHFKERKKGKRKKSDRCSRESSCVGLSRHTLIDQVSHSLILGQRNEFTPLVTFTPISVRQTVADTIVSRQVQEISKSGSPTSDLPVIRPQPLVKGSADR